MSATNRWWRDCDAECALWLAARGETDRRWWERVNDDEIVIPLPPVPPFVYATCSPPSGRTFTVIAGRWVDVTEVTP